MASFATQVQIRRGTDAENDAFTGAEGEVTMDLTNKQLRVHDGQTTGGMKIPNIETVVDKTSNQTITGQKTFQDKPVRLSNTNVTLGTPPTSQQNQIIQFVDSTGREIGSLKAIQNTDGSVIVALTAGNYVDSGMIYESLEVLIASNGNTAMYARTPAISDNSTQIATTAFVHNLLNQVINDSNIGSNYIDIGYVYIGDLLMQWGIVTATTSGVNVPLPRPMKSNSFFVFVSNMDDNGNVPVVKSITATSIQVARNTGSNALTSWLVIGKGA